MTRRLHDDVMREFIHRELDRLGLAHSTFTSGATELIILSADGVGSAWERTVFEAPPLLPPLPPPRLPFLCLPQATQLQSVEMPAFPFPAP